MIVALLPASPRRRRRIAWLAGFGLVAALAIGSIFLLPSPHKIHETFSGPASVDTPGTTHVPPLVHRPIDATIDRFVLAALARGDLGTAWDLSGPDLRGTTTRADWIAGKTPVAPFPIAGKEFHGWTHVVAHPNSVTFDLLIQPQVGAKIGATAFSVQVIRRRGAWVVNRWYTQATFTPVGTKHPHVVGPNHFGAAGRGDGQVQHGRIGRWWLAVPIGLFALGFLTVGIVVGRNWRRYRRMRAAVRAEHADDERRA